MRGIPASPGLACAKAFILKSHDVTVEKWAVQDIAPEIQRFHEALEKSDQTLQSIRQKAFQEMGEDKAAIFDAHLMILKDPEIVKQTIQKMTDENTNAEFAYSEVTQQFVQMFESMDNAYLRERAADLKDVSKRVIYTLLNIEMVDISNLDGDTVIVSDDLTPSETASMDKEKVVGFLTNIGGKTSHTAIMARTLEIPAIVGLSTITETIQNGDMVLMDGNTGQVMINPEEHQIVSFKKKINEYESYRETLKDFHGKPSMTKDGHPIELAGNIGSPDDIEGLKRNDAEGVGLFRTEFLYMNRDRFPTEEEQYEAYKKVLEEMAPKPVVIRTLDVGGDKALDYFDITEEMNPFLGYRAIRVCLDRRDIFRTQLRALLRASVYGKLRIMFPMISCVEELLEAKLVLKSVEEDLRAEGVDISTEIEIGMMIEIPSAAITSDLLAEHVDFFSIGTNDLIQYTCAVDRMNEKIAYLYNPYNPALIRLIKNVIENGHKAGIWVGMCGELAGDSTMIPLLLGLGLDEFSMSPLSILASRKQISLLSKTACESMAAEALEKKSSEELKRFLLSGVS